MASNYRLLLLDFSLLLSLYRNQEILSLLTFLSEIRKIIRNEDNKSNEFIYNKPERIISLGIAVTEKGR